MQNSLLIPLPSGIEFALLAVALAAGASDIKTRRIPNWIAVSGAALGLVLRSYYNGFAGAVLSFEGAALAMGVFLLLHLAGGMGAGDVKLAAAIGALVGPRSFLIVFVLSGLLGGIAAVALAMARHRWRQTLARTGELLVCSGRLRWKRVRSSSRLDSPGALRLPYGAIIAGGALAFLVCCR